MISIKAVSLLMMFILCQIIYAAKEPDIEWNKKIAMLSDSSYKDIKINDIVELQKNVLLAVGEGKLKTDSIVNAYAIKIDLQNGNKIWDTLFQTAYPNSILKTGPSGDSIMFIGIEKKDTTILWITEGKDLKMDNLDTIIVNKKFQPYAIGKFYDNYLISGSGQKLYGKNTKTDRIIDTTIYTIQYMRLVSSGQIHCSGIESGVSLDGGGSTNGLSQVIIDKNIANFSQHKFAHANAPGDFLRPPTSSTVLPNGTFICVGGNDHYDSNFETGVMHRNGAGKELSYKTYKLQNYDVGYYVTALSDSILLIGGCTGENDYSVSGYVRKVVVDKDAQWTKKLPGTGIIKLVSATSDSGFFAFDGTNLVKLGTDVSSIKKCKNVNLSNKAFNYKVSKNAVVFNAHNDLTLKIYIVNGKQIISTDIKKGQEFKVNCIKQYKGKVLLFKIITGKESYSIRHFAY